MNATGQNIVTPEIRLSTCVENILSESITAQMDESYTKQYLMQMVGADGP